MKILKETFLPDLQKLSEKDSNISRSKYIDLGIFIHCMYLSAILFGFLIFFKEWSTATLHIVSMLCWSSYRGFLSKKDVNNEKTN